MDEREELKQELKQELLWVQYRQNMLDMMEKKLIQMREIAEQAKQENLTPGKLEVLNIRLNDLATQVRAIDSESRKNEYGKILE